MSIMVHPAQVQLNKKIASLSVPTLCECFELTNGRQDDGVQTTRCALMDELERRDLVSFDAWMDCDDVEFIHMPSRFFLT